MYRKKDGEMFNSKSTKKKFTKKKKVFYLMQTKILFIIWYEYKNSLTICNPYILSSRKCLYYFQQYSIFEKCKPFLIVPKKDIVPFWT